MTAEKLHPRRKLAFATWGPSRDPNIYGKLSVDASEALAYLDHVRRSTGEPVTMTHLVAKATAEAMRRVPALNGRVVFGRFIPNASIDIGFLVLLDKGRDLAKAKIARIERLSVAEISAELRRQASALRSGRDGRFEKSQRLLRILPIPLIRPMLWATGLLTAKFGIGLGPLGLERLPFGSCIVTNVGAFGMDEGYGPPLPFARVPILIVIGRVRQQPQVISGQVVARPQLTLCATIDHRFVDGRQAAQFGKVLRDVLTRPWRLTT